MDKFLLSNLSKTFLYIRHVTFLPSRHLFPQKFLFLFRIFPSRSTLFPKRIHHRPHLDPITDDFARWLDSRWTHESRCVLEWQLDGRWRFSRYGLSYGVARSRGMRATCPAMCSSLPQLPLIHGACCCVMWSRNRTVPYDHPKVLEPIAIFARTSGTGI